MVISETLQFSAMEELGHLTDKKRVLFLSAHRMGERGGGGGGAVSDNPHIDNNKYQAIYHNYF